MRSCHILLIPFLAGSLHAASWTMLPPIPRGMPIDISGDGNAVLATGIYGAAAMHSSIQTMGLLPADPWVPQSGVVGSQRVLLRKELVAYLKGSIQYGDAGIYYRNLGESTFRKSVMPDAEVYEFSDFDQDGRRIAVILSRWNNKPLLYVSVDSAATDATVASSPEIEHYWRKLTLPVGFGDLYTNGLRCWIEGRLLMVTNQSKTWISSDTGATWSAQALPYLQTADIKGDTIVGRNYSGKRLFVSRDAGATWDSTALDSPTDIAFRGGRLYGLFFLSDTTYELSISNDLGKSWNNLLSEVNISENFVNWDGASLWARRRNELVRSIDGGKSWTAGDSALPLSTVGKIRGFGPSLLVLQKLQGPSSSYLPWHRLWEYQGGTWTFVRDSVLDIEVMDTDTGRAVFALVDSGTKWSTFAWYAHPRLERSFNLKAWQRIPGIMPISVVLGLSKRGLLVGEANRVAVFTRGSKLLVDSAWKSTDVCNLTGGGFLLEQDGAMVWSNDRTMYRRSGQDVVKMGVNTIGYATLGTRFGYLLDTGGVWLDSMKTTSNGIGLPSTKPASGVRTMRDSIATWNGSDTFALMRPDGERRMLGPVGGGVTQVEYVSMSALGSVLAVIDSTWVVADLSGRLWRYDRNGTVGVGPTHARFAPLSLRRGGLSLELPHVARVRIERFDAGGRLVGVVADGVFEPGRHALRLDPIHGVTFAMLVIDGIRQDVVKIPATEF